MRIAILGATSEIARDFTALMLKQGEDALLLYARRPQAVYDWLAANGNTSAAEIHSFEDFPPAEPVDALINFVGIGNPLQARSLGTTILKLTQYYDELALEYIREDPHCRYIFLSSGAVFGPSFERPVIEKSPAEPRINALQTEDWYAIAKLHAEYRHRAIPEAVIVDLRVFSYFSHTQNIDASYFMADVVRALHGGAVLQTSSLNFVRDYLHPTDFQRMVNCILKAPAANMTVDCYSRAPIDKLSLLAAMQTKFGLKYEVVDMAMPPAASVKLNYYSLNHSAEHFGYQPGMTSLDGILRESEKLFGNRMT